MTIRFRLPHVVALAAVFPSLLALASARPALAQDAAPASAPAAPDPNEKVDKEMMARLRDEEMNRSQVVKIATYLTDVIGPRLTGSYGQQRASAWTRDQLSGWGMSNAHLEPWGPFGNGWSLHRFSAQVTEPVDIPLIAMPKAWSPELKHKIEADVVFLNVTDVAQLAAYKGTLKDKVVLISPIREVPAHFSPDATRVSDFALTEMASAPPPQPGGGGFGGGGGRRRGAGGQAPPAVTLVGAINQFLKDEGAALVVDTPRIGDDGTLFMQQGTAMYGPDVPFNMRKSVWEKDVPKDVLPQVSVSVEQYNRIVRMVQAGEKVKMEVELETRVYDADGPKIPADTIAEIPGTDKAGEIVMCGAHLDSWHSGTGATDNGAGSIVCLEAMRLLKTLNVHPRRTIRIGLWTGEEEGLLGSAAYCLNHFGTPESPKPEQKTLAAYFNLDNGTGKVRGVYGQGNAAVLPIFAAWLAPFADLGATTVTTRNTGGTDHLSFDHVGIPGFQFIQDSIDYGSRTHHSNQDVYDRLQIDDLKQASLLMAAFLYDAAMRDQPLPRKPLPPAAAPGT